MNFETRKIRKHIEKPKPLKGLSKNHIRIHLPIFASLLILLLLAIGTVKALSSVDFTLFLKVAGEDLLTDNYNNTNFLVLGTGGKEHEGGNLTDTILVASINHDNKMVTMVSIPRDMWVKDTLIGNRRINELYYWARMHFDSSTQGLEHMKGKVEEIVGMPIHYYVKIDFQGFKDLVDAIGGIDVNVSETINDPYYPKDGTFLYEPFYLAAGQHHMNGDVALKYARSRKTTSDFDRADRQQQIIYAIKEKALQTEVILSTEKIKALLNALKQNIETNIKVKEILTMGSFAGDFKEENITHRLIHDDPTQCGGFLYTPERQYYNGQFVLIPAGGYEYVHRYASLNFNFPLVGKEDLRIHLLNGSKRGGVAGETKMILQRHCFTVNRYGNAKSQDLTKTTYYYRDAENRPESLTFLQTMIPGEETTIIPEEYQEYMLETDIIIELGDDYISSKNYIEDPFIYLFSAPAAATPAATETTTTTETVSE